MRLTADDEMWVDAGGVEIHVAVAGETPAASTPLAVLLHGAGQAAAVWEPLASHLADRGWTVLSLDLPGHGRSRATADTSIESLAAIVAEVIEQAPRDRALVVGHSMGGLVGLELAARRPELVESLIVTGTGAGLPVNDLLLDAARAEDGSAADLFERWAHSRSAEDSARDATRRMIEGLDEGVLHAALVACDRYESGVESAAAITAPTLIIQGEHDVMVDSCEGARLELALNNVVSVVIPGAGHNVSMDRPELLVAAVEEFLSAQSAESG